MENDTKQDTAEQTSADSGTTSSVELPDISKNLFWDDARIGFQVIGAGALVVVLGMLMSTGSMLVGGIVSVIGLLVLVAGTKIACALAEELPAGKAVYASLGLLKLAVLARLVLFFLPESTLHSGIHLAFLAAAFLAAACFGLAISGSAKYLGQPVLAARGSTHMIIVGVAAVISFLLALIAMMDGLADSAAHIGGALMLTPVFGSLAYLSFEVSLAIKQVTLGLVGEQSAAEEEDDLYEEEVPHAPEGTELFPQELQTKLHAEDNSAGRAIVVLMTAVFSVGVVLYAIVAVVTS